MILADLWVIGSSLYYLIARGTISSDESGAIITIGAFIALIPTPINLSLIIRNLKGMSSQSGELPETDTPPENTGEGK
jgi:hypothetical protein